MKEKSGECVITLEKEKQLKEEEEDVMLVGQRTTKEREPNTGIARPRKKKGKAKDRDDTITKKKRDLKRKFHVSDFPLGDGQSNYSLRDDVASKKEPRRGSLRIMSIVEL